MLCLLVLVSACSASQSNAPHAPTASVECAIADAPARAGADLENLHASVESGPLFLAAARHEGFESCAASLADSALILEYAFKRGGTLRTQRDASIEYTEQIAKLMLPPSADAVALLRAAELHAFGSTGVVRLTLRSACRTARNRRIDDRASL